MADVNEALTQKVADLARLELSEQELKNFTQQLRDVLGYVEQLSKIDVSGIEPMTHPLDSPSPLRADELHPFPTEGGHPKVLKHAPETLNDGFKVPPIL